MGIHDFAALHQGAEPLVLFNVWDAGSARAVAEAGAQAIATGSFSVAGAQGYDDGEELPLDCLLQTVSQISSATDLPLSVDFETGFAVTLQELADNAAALRKAGAIGCNLEDRLPGNEALRDLNEQCKRIACVQAAGLFVNARTDMFLGPLMAGENPNREDLVEAALKRGEAYLQAGAGCFFVPGLSDPDLIARLCRETNLPVNVMRLDGMVDNASLSSFGVARISYGPGPWREAMAHLTNAARAALEEG